jgi:hypothetical protein
MPYHLEYYGGFIHDWARYVTQTENGVETPYWHNQKLQKSTWDSPTLILSSLIMNGIESDDQHFVQEWEGIEGTPFVKILVKTGPKKKDHKYLYLHRFTKQVFSHNPLETIQAP